MLDQLEIDRLLALLKDLHEKSILFPRQGRDLRLNVTAQKSKDQFNIIINYKSKIAKKCTYLEKYSNDILLKLHFMGAPHENPDNTVIHCPHIHIAKENFNDSWAFPIDTVGIKNSDDLIEQLFDFLQFCNIINLEDIDIQHNFINEVD
jgi:hypothetical protein